MSSPASSKQKRMSFEMRHDHSKDGAFIIEFKQPKQPFDVYMTDDRSSPFVGDKPALLSGAKYQSISDQYRVMERKGFKVTKDTGCLIPEDQYCKVKEGSTLKGHQRSFGFFARFVPDKDDNFGLRNEFGWPCTLQISHLCHRRKCCRIDHLIAEEQWRNLKRNYCGFGGSCDCGSDIPCIRRYYPSDYAEMPTLCATKEEVKEALSDVPDELTFNIRDLNYFADRDAVAKKRKVTRDKSKNAEGRKRAGALQQHASAKKAAKKAAKEQQQSQQQQHEEDLDHDSDD